MGQSFCPIGFFPVKGKKEGNRKEQREGSSCNASWAASADTTGSSRLEGGQNCPAMGKDNQVFISASTVIVCGCPWDDLTLSKVAFYTKAILEATGSWNMSAGSTLHSLATSALWRWICVDHPHDHHITFLPYWCIMIALALGFLRANNVMHLSISLLPSLFPWHLSWGKN